MAEGFSLKIKEGFHKAVQWLSAKMTEPSSWKGITLIVSAGSWNRLDNTNKGEIIMQLGLIIFGLILFLFSQDAQYGVREEKK